MSEENEKKPVVEWSFSFDKLGDSINEQVKKMGIGDGEVKHDHYSAPLESANTAAVKLDLSVGRVTVKALGESPNLIEADVTYVGEMVFEVSGEADKKVRLGQKRGLNEAFNQIVNREDLRWDISLSPALPLSLDVNGGVGKFELDLSGLKLTKLSMNGGVGDNRVTLPATGSSYSAKLKGGVGAVRATISEGAAVNLTIEGGVGGTDVQVPAGAAVQVRVEGGLGGASFPSNFKRVKGGSDFISMTGVWETEGYSLASQQIRVDFRGGVGGLKVHSAG